MAATTVDPTDRLTSGPSRDQRIDRIWRYLARTCDDEGGRADFARVRGGGQAQVGTIANQMGGTLRSDSRMTGMASGRTGSMIAAGAIGTSMMMLDWHVGHHVGGAASDHDLRESGRMVTVTGRRRASPRR